jgi:hypothetical protein
MNKGDKVVCSTLLGGCHGDRDIADKYLKIGGTYTIEKTIEQAEWETDVYLQEFPNVPFNSVFFADS